jgi:hypothetical protein
MAMGKKNTGRGIGSALYERVREMARNLDSYGIFSECQSDDKSHFKDTGVLRQNRSRLKFFEQYGAFPILNTHYEENSQSFVPDFLVIAFGLDTVRGDPTGTWKLESSDFLKCGTMIGKKYLPTLVVQEVKS